ncbi:hypothetical protein, partial [Oleiphilus sp. HI0067]|uniref:hypothetical protein n=1 Tax=Oleiphilus sp. HI0067 TaxID=1822243 RepID=UPI001E41EE6E
PGLPLLRVAQFTLSRFAVRNDAMERRDNRVERVSDPGRLWGVGVFGETKTLTCRRPAPTGTEE